MPSRNCYWVVNSGGASSHRHREFGLEIGIRIENTGLNSLHALLLLQELAAIGQAAPNAPKDDTSRNIGKGQNEVEVKRLGHIRRHSAGTMNLYCVILLETSIPTCSSGLIISSSHQFLHRHSASPPTFAT